MMASVAACFFRCISIRRGGRVGACYIYTRAYIRVGVVFVFLRGGGVGNRGGAFLFGGGVATPPLC